MINIQLTVSLYCDNILWGHIHDKIQQPKSEKG